MEFLYKDSWKLYKAHTETFIEDRNYYYEFCKDHETLELFAGYGRLSNYLASKKVNLEVVEIEKKFADFISLDPSKVHIKNVLNFQSNQKFDRIIAGYNSFCLFTKEIDIKKLFSLIEHYLKPGGYATLNYFDTNYWTQAACSSFFIGKTKVEYSPNYDLSKKNKGYAKWIDKYILHHPEKVEEKLFHYTVRVYENSSSLKPFYGHTTLKLIDEIKNFGLRENEVSELGWIDYVFKKPY